MDKVTCLNVGFFISKLHGVRLNMKRNFSARFGYLICSFFKGVVLEYRDLNGRRV